MNTSDSGTPSNPAQSGKKIVIDAGHGDHDPGATGVTGKKEKDFSLAMALKVPANFGAGFETSKWS
ncbi:N-acetylmuramoyl-L-alanine amidase [Paenibacillus sp. JTLBN-2024]